jgi:predicted Zn-dependent protease
MKKIIYIGLIALFAFVGCQKTPYTDRSQLVLFSHEQEMSLGLNASQDILKKEKLSRDKKKVEMVNRVGHRIAQVTDADFDWEFHVIEKDVLNAFCLPGGKVFVYEGIFKAIENEGQLATLMSHEIAHALARHGIERMSMAQLAGIGKVVVGEATGLRGSQAFDLAFGIGTQYGVMLPYSRNFEYEADEIGIYLMKKAGYDLNEAVNFWKNMKAQKKGNAPAEFMSTHPTDDNRIANIKEIIARLNH